MPFISPFNGHSLRAYYVTCTASEGTREQLQALGVLRKPLVLDRDTQKLGPGSPFPFNITFQIT